MYTFYQNRKEAYLLRIGNAVMYSRLIELGLSPAKSLTAKFPEVPQACLAAFVRGYFDGDGCAFIERNRRGQVRRLLAIFTSGSPEFLRALHAHLVAETGIKGAGFQKHGSTKGAYQLRYSTRDSLRLYLFMYNPEPDSRLCLRRKYDIFKQYLELRGLDVYSIPSVLDAQGPVVK